MPKKQNLIIIIPVYNDWSSLVILIRELDKIFSRGDLYPHLVVIDDGSIESCDKVRQEIGRIKGVKNIDIIHLARNLGHQKAITLGLAYINSKLKYDKVIVMDCDGEDRPENILQLLDESAMSPTSIIFAERTHRKEGLIFRFFYAFYKFFFFILTGTEISFGNFSIIPSHLLKRIVYLPEIWNHFAAGVIYARLSWKVIPLARGRRYVGQSKMNFVSLIIHGLSAISVFTEILTVRLILSTLIVILFGITGFFILGYIKYFTVLAIPGWATNVAIGLIAILSQALVLLVLLSFVILNNRITRAFIPVKDFEDYIFSIERIL
jgi:hypothetical protein